MALSINSRKTSKSRVTVDDILSELDSRTGKLSLNKAKREVHKLAGKDKDVANETIGMLADIKVQLRYIAPGKEIELIHLMFDNDAVLGGLQATSYFYPVSSHNQAPWDFFVSSSENKSDKFIAGFVSLTGLSCIECSSSIHNGSKTLLFSRHLGNETKPVYIRIFVSNENAISSVMKLKNSLQHGFMSPVVSVYMWPTMMLGNEYTSTVFKSNTGLDYYPATSKKILNQHTKTTRVESRASNVPVIKTGLGEFEVMYHSNQTGLDPVKFDQKKKEISSIVYATSRSSVRYLGYLSGM